MLQDKTQNPNIPTLLKKPNKSQMHAFQGPEFKTKQCESRGKVWAIRSDRVVCISHLSQVWKCHSKHL